MASANYRLNSLFALFAKAGGSVATLLTTMLLARMLSKADFASYVMAYTVVTLGSLLGPLGMGNAILRFAGYFLGADRPAAAERVTKRCVAIGACGLLVVAASLSLCHESISRYLATWPEGLLGTALVSVWLAAAGLLLLTTSGLRAYGRIALGSLTEITIPRAAVLAVTCCLFLWKVESLTVVLAASATAVCLVALGSIVALKTTLPPRVRAAAPDVPRREIANFALPLLASNVLYQLMTDSTLFFVAYFCRVEEIAFYGAAYRIWGVFGLPQSAVATAIQGRIAELHAAGNSRALESLSRNSANMATLPTALITGVVCFAASPLLALFYGTSFSAGGQALIVLCLMQFVSVAIGPSDHLLAMSGRQGTVFLAAMASAAAAFLLGWSLTPLYGSIGAAFAGGTAILLFKLLLAWQAYRQFRIRTWIGLTRLEHAPRSFVPTSNCRESSS